MTAARAATTVRGSTTETAADAPSEPTRPDDGAREPPSEPVPRGDRRRPHRAATTGRRAVTTADRRRSRTAPDRGPRRDAGGGDLTASEAAEVAAARGSVSAERAELEASEASPEALAAGKAILEQLMAHLGFDVKVEVDTGETSRLNVVGEGDEREALGALIGRKGERLSALQHLVNLMLSKEMGSLDARARRRRGLPRPPRAPAPGPRRRAAARVVETGKMLQLEPMPALERRWIHLTLREHPGVATQSIGEEPNRRVVLVPRTPG